MTKETEFPLGLAKELKKTGQRPEDFVSLVAPYRPGDENIVLEGEDARRFTEMLAHNEKCLGADANPPCEPCARRHEFIFRAKEEFGVVVTGGLACKQCPYTIRDSQARLDTHIKVAHQEKHDNF